jgi:hypothetical protein
MRFSATFGLLQFFDVSKMGIRQLLLHCFRLRTLKTVCYSSGWQFPSAFAFVRGSQSAAD